MRNDALYLFALSGKSTTALYAQRYRHMFICVSISMFIIGLRWAMFTTTTYHIATVFCYCKSGEFGLIEG